jgi:hypothetical protein
MEAAMKKKRMVLWTLGILVLMFPFTAFGDLPPIKGDINNNGNITLHDAILALQITAGINAGNQIFSSADVNGDHRIGMADAIYILQCLSASRVAENGGGSGVTCVWDRALWDNCLWDQ